LGEERIAIIALGHTEREGTMGGDGIEMDGGSVN
jgi:hypothetical protein